MSGLDKLLRQIESTAQDNANAKIEQARQQAEQLILEAENKAKEESQIKLQKNSEEVEDIIKRAKSAASLHKRKAVLSAKQQIIQETIHRTRELLKSMPSEEYFDLLQKMILHYSLPMNGEIIFSKHDKERFPADFEHQLNKSLKANGGSLKLSAEDRPIDGGFILVYGEVEENCSFDAILASKEDILQDKVNKILFT
jgi:V/A-type H+-transporting ATPase subunit E